MKTSQDWLQRNQEFMTIEHEEFQSDGSSWAAHVRVHTILFVATYVNNKLVVRLAPYKHNPRRPAWFMVQVRKWAECRVREFDPAWLALHQAMYNEGSAE